MGKPAPAGRESQGGRSRFAVFIENFELDLVGRQAGKEKVRFIAEAEVLRALAYVKLELCLPFPTIPAVEREEAVFEFQPTKSWSERLLVEG